MCCGVLIGGCEDACGVARIVAPPCVVNACSLPGIGGRFFAADGCCGWQSKKNASGAFSAIDVSARPGGVLVVGRNNQRALRRRALPCKIAWVERERSIAAAPLAACVPRGGWRIGKPPYGAMPSGCCALRGLFQSSKLGKNDSRRVKIRRLLITASTFMDERINDLILAGEIAALTIDTSIFERNGLALESGLLAQLEQFRDSEFEFVIANTVASEVKRHLAKNATDATKALCAALVHTAKHRALSSAHQEELTALSNLAIADDDARARKRFDDWAQRVGANVIHEDEFALIGEVMRRYEAGKPPFAETGGKKQEFPDAVALSTLEGWAEEYDTRILAVAHDKDWQRYGAQSKRLVVIDDLADALSTIQGLGAAREPAVRLATLFVGGDAVGLHAAVLEAARHQVDKFEFRVEADSQFFVQEEGVEATVADIGLDIPDATGATLETISHDKGQAAIKINGTASLNIDVHFSFEKFDSIDRDYVGMGSTTISRDVEIEFEALVTVQIDGDGLTLDGVELLPVTHYLQFNDIEPDWMSDPDNYDTDDGE